MCDRIDKKYKSRQAKFNGKEALLLLFPKFPSLSNFVSLNLSCYLQPYCTVLKHLSAQFWSFPAW
jgi:hypothetical protein